MHEIDKEKEHKATAQLDAAIRANKECQATAEVLNFSVGDEMDWEGLRVVHRRMCAVQ